MSLGPDKIPISFDLLAGATTATGTFAGVIVSLPGGSKAVGLFLTSSATLTLKVQNSVDRINFFDVATATGLGSVAEVSSTAPYWRAVCSAFTTGGTGTNPQWGAAICVKNPDSGT